MRHRGTLQIALSLFLVAGVTLVTVTGLQSYDVRSVGSDGYNGHEYGTRTAMRSREIAVQTKGTDDSDPKKTVKRWMGMTEKIDYLEAGGGEVGGNLAFEVTDARHYYSVPFTPFYDDLKIERSGYQPCFHCDRIPGESHSAAYLDAMAWVRFAIARAVHLCNKGGQENHHKAAVFVGIALHTVQDLSTHSNIVDLGEEQYTEIRRALSAGFYPGTSQLGDTASLKDGKSRMKKTFEKSKIKLPEGLKITGFDNNASGNTKYYPKGDSFPHGHGPDSGNSKDGPDTYQGKKSTIKGSIGALKHKNKYYAARKIGADFSIDVLEAIKKRLTTKESSSRWNSLIDTPRRISTGE